MKRTTSFIRNFTLFIVVVLLTACNLPVTPVVPVEVTLKPTRTPTLPPTHTPTHQPVFTLVSPTADPVIFRDEFNGRLEPGWTWIREVPKQWSLIAVPGSLQIDAGRGYVNAQTMTNVLLRPAPTGDFQIETKLTFLPQDNYQFAGLIIYDSYANFLQAGHAYCRAGVCVREGIYMDYYDNGIATLPNFAHPYNENTVVILRLIRKGTTYILQVSTDGSIFFVTGEHMSDMNPLQVGLVAGQNIDGEIIPALFDYFEITGTQ